MNISAGSTSAKSLVTPARPESAPQQPSAKDSVQGARSVATAVESSPPQGQGHSTTDSFTASSQQRRTLPELSGTGPSPDRIQLPTSEPTVLGEQPLDPRLLGTGPLPGAPSVFSRDINTHVRALGEGDTYTLKQGVEVTAGLALQGENEIEVTREGENEYIVSEDGGAAIGVEVGPNVKAPGVVSAGVEGSGTGGGGFKREYSFETAEEAARAAQILANPGGATAEDSQFLEEHLAALEVHLDAQGAAEAEAILGQKGVAALGAGASGELGYSASVRIEFEDGEPSAVVLAQELKSEGSLGLQAKAAGSEVEGGLAGPQANGSVSLETERRAPLPEDFDLARFQRDPLGALSSVAGELQAATPETTLTADVSGSAVGTGGGGELEVKFSGDASVAFESGAVDEARAGNLQAAAERLAEATELEGSFTPYTDHGVSLAPELKLGGVGVGVEYESRRRDKADEPLFEFGQSPAERAATSAASLLRQVQHNLRSYLPG